MLKEFDSVSQEKNGFRRLFTDEYFELYLWYERRGGAMTGFQLCYDPHEDPRSLTCTVRGDSTHTRIDEGEAGGAMHYKASPILGSDGVFPRDSLRERFVAASLGLDEAVRKMVLEAIDAYPVG